MQKDYMVMTIYTSATPLTPYVYQDIVSGYTVPITPSSVSRGQAMRMSVPAESKLTFVKSQQIEWVIDEDLVFTSQIDLVFSIPQEYRMTDINASTMTSTMFNQFILTTNPELAVASGYEYELIDTQVSNENINLYLVGPQPVRAKWNETYSWWERNTFFDITDPPNFTEQGWLNN